MSSRSLRVLQVGLGPLGIQIAGDLARRGIGRVVAAVDPAPALAGKPLGDVLPGGDPAVRIAPALGDITAEVDVAIVATVSDLRACAPTLHELAARGISAVATCEELAWPWDRHPEVARELAAVAERHGVRLLGTGVNPGFVMDALAIAVTTACAAVRRIEIQRVQDATSRRLPFQKKIGATLAARGVHQEARAYAGGREVITMIFRAAIAEPDARDRILVDGEPPVDLTIRNGLHGDVSTSAVVLNSVRSLLGARPGLHTMTTLPLAGCAR